MMPAAMAQEGSLERSTLGHLYVRHAPEGIRLAFLTDRRHDLNGHRRCEPGVDHPAAERVRGRHLGEAHELDAHRAEGGYPR